MGEKKDIFLIQMKTLPNGDFVEEQYLVWGIEAATNVVKTSIEEEDFFNLLLFFLVHREVLKLCSFDLVDEYALHKFFQNEAQFLDKFDVVYKFILTLDDFNKIEKMYELVPTALYKYKPLLSSKEVRAIIFIIPCTLEDNKKLWYVSTQPIRFWLMGDMK